MAHRVPQQLIHRAKDGFFNHGATNMSTNVYIENGYRNRAHYLESLSEQLEVDLDTVHALADFLGPSEDFDGLVTSLKDYAEGL